MFSKYDKKQSEQEAFGLQEMPDDNCFVQNLLEETSQKKENLENQLGLIIQTLSSIQEQDITENDNDFSDIENYEDYTKQLKFVFNQKAIKTRNDYLDNFQISESQENLTPQGEIPCQICGDTDYEEDDTILICQSCDLGVHFHCYGVDKIPSGEWLCQLCQEFPRDQEYRKNMSCLFCTNKGGLMRKTSLLNDQYSYPNYQHSSEKYI